MTEQVVDVIEKGDGTERVCIVRRTDGSYSFRRQWKDGGSHRGSGTLAWREGYAGQVGWGPLGLYAGIYDSMETAKWEALCRVEWLVSATEPH